MSPGEYLPDPTSGITAPSALPVATNEEHSRDGRRRPCPKCVVEPPGWLSVVIPVYNSASIFPELHRRLTSVLERSGRDFEILAVVDGARDGSYDVIADIAAHDPRVKAMELSRNFGHQVAIAAGYRHAIGDVIIAIDDDLEDPPEVLPAMLARLDEGYDVVYGVRKHRVRALPYRVLYRAFYRFLGFMVSTRIPYDSGDFCVMRRNVANALNAMPESSPFLRGLRAWSGFRQTGFEYDREPRYAGESGYTLRKYLSLAVDAIFSFSYKPLRLVTYAGVALFVLSLVLTVWGLTMKYMGAIRDVPGWTSLFVAVVFFSGIQLLSIGIIGEYLSRIYDEVKRRPKYLVTRCVGVTPREGV